MPQSGKKISSSDFEALCALNLSTQRRLDMQVGRAKCDCCCVVGVRFRPSVMAIDAEALTTDVAVMFAMKEKREIWKLFGQIYDTPNLTETDKELISDATKIYNKVACEHNVDNTLTFDNRQRALREHLVIRHQMQEHCAESQAAETFGISHGMDEQRWQQRRTDSAREQLRALRENVDAEERQYEANREVVHMQAAQCQEEPDERSVVTNSNTDNAKFVTGGNPYINDAAGEA